MKRIRFHLVLASSLMLLLNACGSSSGSPSVVDVPSYRVYVRSLRDYVSAGRPDSFEEGEQAKLTELSGEILQILGNARNFRELDDAQKESLTSLNEELHLLMVGEDSIRADERICRVSAQTGSNIRTTSCRTRSRIAQDRAAAQRLLIERGDDVDRNRILDESRPGGFGTPTLN